MYRTEISGTRGDQYRIERQVSMTGHNWVTIDKYLTADPAAIPRKKKTRPWMLLVPELFVLKKQDEPEYPCTPANEMVLEIPVLDGAINLVQEGSPEGPSCHVCGAIMARGKDIFLCKSCGATTEVSPDDGRDYGDESDHEK